MRRKRQPKRWRVPVRHEKEAEKLEEIKPLKLLIDPGEATKEEISEFFLELSTLYQMVGGSGLDFTITNAREFVRELA